MTLQGLSSIEPGDTIGPCQIIRRIGRGGMGEVFLAKHLNLNKDVAIKVLPPLSASPEMVQRFVKEGQLCSQVEHSNVVMIYDVGEHAGLYYIVMQFIDGQDLREVVVSQGPLPWETAAKLIRFAAKGLGEAHQKGLVHRDITPGNIMLGRDGRVVVMDFGLVRGLSDPGLTQTGTAMGTPPYMSREQCAGENPDIRWDIYSLGATLYYLITGRAPYEGPLSKIFAEKHQGKNPCPIEQIAAAVPRELAQVVAKAMAHRKEDRYQDAKSLSQALKSVLSLADAPAHESGESILATGILIPVAPSSQPGPPSPIPIVQPRQSAPAKFDFSFGGKLWWFVGAGVLFLLVSVSLILGRYLSVNSPPPGTEEMIFIKRGQVQLGNSEASVRQHIGPCVKDAELLESLVEFINEEPRVSREVDEFWIDPYEVTNTQYAKFLAATRRQSPEHWTGPDPPAGKEDHPIVNISYDDAEAYAKWAGKKLPTLEQWVRAFRGDSDDLFPWGNRYDPLKANVGDNPAFPSTSPVGATPEDKSVFGVYNMVGNAGEYVRGTSLRNGRPVAFVKGGDYGCVGYAYGNGAMRVSIPLDLANGTLGVRCVVERP